MLNQPVPSPDEGEEITQSDLKRQEFEQELALSNWRFFIQSDELFESSGNGQGSGRIASGSDNPGV